MKLKAIDSIHVSSVQAASLRKGEQFEVSDAEGAQLIERGLASIVAAPKPTAKKAPAAGNKMAAAPGNKAAAKIAQKRAR